jgi:hypothetical protein
VESYYWAWRNEDAIRTADWKFHRFFDHNELYDIRQDEGETNNVAGTHPDVVKALTGRMNGWAGSLGAALTHQPAPMKFDATPAPEGEVLEVTVTVTRNAKANDRLIVPIANLGVNPFATDCIEYDIATVADSLQQGFHYSPLKGNDNTTVTAIFKRGEGIDQFGREQAACPAIKGGPGIWEHRVIGLCSYAPGTLPRHGFVFKGGKPGTYTIYLDNLRLRRADGSTTPIWTDGKDTRFRKIEDSGRFTKVHVRPVPAAQVGKQPFPTR